MNRTFEFKQEACEKQFKKKYMINGEKSASEALLLCAEEIASSEKSPDLRDEFKTKFYTMMMGEYFFPGGRTLSNARPKSPLKNYFNCFYIPMEDSIESIFDTVKKSSQIMKFGGGVGINISNLSPRGTVTNKGGEASGPVSFLRVFNQAASIIKTRGDRFAAQIALLDVSHPDIEEFITAKQGDKNNELRNFNVSVVITEKFMTAVKCDYNWDLTFNGKIYRTIKAKDLYEKIMKNQFIHNEPGLFFIDTVNFYNNGFYNKRLKLNGVNPCGEQPLYDWGSCNLGSINFSKFVIDPFSDTTTFDMENFKNIINLSVRFLDNVIDSAEYPTPEIREMEENTRRIGLGFTGLADMLAMMKIKYGSDVSLSLIGKIMSTLRDESYRASVQLAKERGPFPLFDKKLIGSNFIKNLPEDIIEGIKKHGLRNIALNTVAPTGTTSLACWNNCSTGIEPIFDLAVSKKIKKADGTIDENGTIFYNAAYMEFISKFGKDAKTPDYFVTIKDLNAEQHIKVQAVVQRYVDSSISKTVNLPHGFTFDQYKDLMMLAYDKGLKGFTTFNPDGSMKGILESAGEIKQAEPADYVERRDAPDRPSELPCDIHAITVMNKGEKEQHIVLVSFLNGTVYEVFNTIVTKQIPKLQNGKGVIKKLASHRYDLIIDGEAIVEDLGNVFDKYSCTLSRFISMALRHGTPLQFVVEQLNKDRANQGLYGFDMALARVLKKYISEGEKVLSKKSCPVCGNRELVYRDGCIACTDITCNWSKCG